MAPRKPNPASATGPDPGRINDDTTAFLGASLVDDDELAKLVSAGLLVEGQAFPPGKIVVPKPGDNWTVVFAVFFGAGLRFSCNVAGDPSPLLGGASPAEPVGTCPSRHLRLGVPDRRVRTERRAFQHRVPCHRELEDGGHPGRDKENSVRKHEL